MREFFVSTTLSPDPEYKSVAGQLPLAQYKDNAGRNLRVNSALSLDLIKVLVAAKPGSTSFSSIVTQLKASVHGLVGSNDDVINDAIGVELMNLLVQNVIKLSLDEVIVVPLSAKPVAYRLARVQAELGQNWATNLLHQPVGISPAHAAVLELLDGSRDHAALQAELLTRLKDGRLNANRGQERITAEAELTLLAGHFCKQALNDLRQLMVLTA